MAISLNNTKNNFSFITSSQKKQRMLLSFLVLILLIITAIIYFGYFKDNSAKETAVLNTGVGVNQSSANMMELIKKISTENLIYNNKRFSDLVIHGDLPVTVGEKGRGNPFVPF